MKAGYQEMAEINRILAEEIASDLTLMRLTTIFVLGGEGLIGSNQGDIYFADLSPVIGSEQGGFRPVLIIQNDIGNRYSPTVIISAITSRITKAHLPTHVGIRATCPV